MIFRGKKVKKLISLIGIVSLVMVTSAMSVFAAERIVIKVPTWGLPEGKDYYKVADTLDIGAAQSLYNVTLYQMLNPNVKIEHMTWDMWSAEAGQKLLAALAAGTAPAFYYTGHIGGQQYAITEGFCADITDYVQDAKDKIVWSVWQDAWRGDRCYGLPAAGMYSRPLAYRVDWFRNAGIFDKKGEPAPSENWTWEDFRNIATKITDPKKKHWGIGIAIGWFWHEVLMSYGVQYMIPDPTGKYTWRGNLNCPESVATGQFIHDLVFKDKCALTGTEFWYGENNNAFKSGKTGMLVGINSTHVTSVNHWKALPEIAEEMRAGKPYQDVVAKYVRLMYPPCLPNSGRYTRNSSRANLFAVNPLMSKEQIEATTDWILWNRQGKGKTWGFINRYLRGLVPYPQVILAYEVDTAGLPPVENYYPENYVKWERKFSSIPRPPSQSTFGLKCSRENEFFSVLDGPQSASISIPDANMKKILDEANKRVNTTVFNYKEKGITSENFKAYYNALKDFMEKNWPDFYKNYWMKIYERDYLPAFK